jgi:hypothetical protein
LFAVSTGRLQRPEIPLTVLGSLAADPVGEAIVRGVRAGSSVEGWLAALDRLRYTFARIDTLVIDG